MALFTEDAHVVVHMDARDPWPTQDLHGSAALAPGLRRGTGRDTDAAGRLLPLPRHRRRAGRGWLSAERRLTVSRTYTRPSIF